MDIPKKVNFDYSLKNIPIQNRDTYMKQLIQQVEKVIQRIRWKTYFFLNPPKKTPPERFGFNTPHNAPQCRELTNFESDVTHLIANLEFKETHSPFQNKLKKDIKYIEQSKNVFVIADKTSNVYEVTKEVYNKHLRDNITNHYQKGDNDTENMINQEAKHITENLEISDRVEPIAHKNAYLTIKDHKEGFPNTVKCRLINPAKSNIGLISKQKLQHINEQIRHKHSLNQWRSTSEVLEWYKKVPNKINLNFLQLDIVDFYPSISEALFNKAIEFASETVTISHETRQILKNARKSLLFSNGCNWQKKTGIHDVTMGSFDGCEVCELVGLLILNEMKKSFPAMTFGLYRDDGLGVHPHMPGPDLERMKKQITAVFKKLELKITIDTNLVVVNFLDTTLNLNEGSYEPYRKPLDKPLYIHNQSNHPKCVLKQVPISVENRLNSISSSEQIFNNAKEEYQRALKDSGHSKHKLEWKTIETSNQKRRRRRKEIFFNPPFCKNLKTNIGKQFLKLLNKNFPSTNPLSKILNRKTIKISYTCAENMERTIKKHNNKILNQETPGPEQQNKKMCNCRKKEKCPVKNKCLTESVIYKAKVKHDNNEMEYIGLTDNTFKTRFNEHNNTFKNESKKKSTTLAHYIWENKLNPEPTIEWSILQKCPRYAPGQKTCFLCLSEKIHILDNINNPKSLNKRQDIGNKCVLHKKRHYLDKL